MGQLKVIHRIKLTSTFHRINLKCFSAYPKMTFALEEGKSVNVVVPVTSESSTGT